MLTIVLQVSGLQQVDTTFAQQLGDPATSTGGQSEPAAKEGSNGVEIDILGDLVGEQDEEHETDQQQQHKQAQVDRAQGPCVGTHSSQNGSAPVNMSHLMRCLLGVDICACTWLSSTVAQQAS
jgi:hypothetical protein